MKQWTDIRIRVLNEGVSKRQILQETGMHWKTLEKILAHGQPPGYRQKTSRSRPKIGPFLNRIEDILKTDKSLPKKQRHTAQRIFERIRQEGYEGQYGAVKEATRCSSKPTSVNAQRRSGTVTFRRSNSSAAYPGESPMTTAG